MSGEYSSIVLFNVCSGANCSSQPPSRAETAAVILTNLALALSLREKVYGRRDAQSRTGRQSTLSPRYFQFTKGRWRCKKNLDVEGTFRDGNRVEIE
jgi:hypothetical protein